MIAAPPNTLPDGSKLENKLQYAWEQQRCCIPEGGTINGVEIAIGYEPLDWLSGDYADHLLMRDGRIVVALADVSGHSLPSALVALRLHAMLHSALKSRMTLSDVANQLNEYLCDYSTQSSFVTMICAMISARTGAIEYFNAGHVPPIVVGPSGETRKLRSGENLPLGVLPGRVKCHRDSMAQGELLALFSDGWSELKTQSGARVGFEPLRVQLSSLYASCPHAPLHQIKQAFESTFLRGHERYVSEDDRTLLFARRTYCGR